MKLDTTTSIAVKEELEVFQIEYQMEILIAAYGGSQSIGTNNTFSDFDIYVIFNNNSKAGFPRKRTLHTKKLGHDLHLISCYKSEILEALQKYLEKPRQYPSYLHRTQEEMELNHNLTMYEREDYPRSLVLYTLMADDSWTFAYAKEELYQMFQNGLNIADAVDFYYTKAYGNYNHFIDGLEYVLARKYITTVQEILYCRWIYENRTVPPMDVMELINHYKEKLTANLYAQIIDVYNSNRFASVGKRENMVVCSPTLNEFIFEWLQILSDGIPTLADMTFSL